MAERFDVVVAGGGLGGLTAAALLARSGWRVLVLERQRVLGGCATAFRRGLYRFDAAASFLGATREGEQIARVLETIGAADRVRFAHVGANLRIVLPDRALDTRNAASGDPVAAAFPNERRALARVQRVLEAIGRDVQRFSALRPWQRALLPLFCPSLLRYARSRLGRLLDREIRDPALRVVLSHLPATAPPRELALLFAGVVLSKSGRESLCYPAGGMGAFTAALAEGARRHGAELRTGEGLAAIEHDGRRVTAVRTDAGARIGARAVVAAFDPNDVLARLEGPGRRRIEKARRRAARFRYSASAFLVYLGLDPAADWSHEHFLTSIFETIDLDAAYGAVGRGELPERLIHHVTFPDASGAPETDGAAPTAKIMTIVPYEPFARWRAEGEAVYRERKQAFAESILARVGAHVPALRSGVRFVEAASPLTLERWTGNPRGAIYGLEPTPEQFGPWRWPNAGVLGGLAFAGHYARPSHGIVGVCFSGEFAADAVGRYLRGATM